MSSGDAISLRDRLLNNTRTAQPAGVASGLSGGGFMGNRLFRNRKDGLFNNVIKKALDKAKAQPKPSGEFRHDPNNPERTLAYITEQLQKRKNDLYWPLEDQLIESLDDTRPITDARTNAVAAGGVQAGLAARSLQRMGAQLTPAQKMAIDAKMRLGDSLRVDDAVNNARLDVQERNDAVLSQLMNNSRALTGQAIDGMSNAASLQANRKQAYDAAKAQYHNNKVGAASSIASAGLMFAFL